jgi:hypothetical protein
MTELVVDPAWTNFPSRASIEPSARPGMPTKRTRSRRRRSAAGADRILDPEPPSKPGLAQSAYFVVPRSASSSARSLVPHSRYSTHFPALKRTSQTSIPETGAPLALPRALIRATTATHSPRSMYSTASIARSPQASRVDLTFLSNASRPRKGAASGSPSAGKHSTSGSRRSRIDARSPASANAIHFRARSTFFRDTTDSRQRNRREHVESSARSPQAPTFAA